MDSDAWNPGLQEQAKGDDLMAPLPQIQLHGEGDTSDEKVQVGTGVTFPSLKLVPRTTPRPDGMAPEHGVPQEGRVLTRLSPASHFHLHGVEAEAAGSNVHTPGPISSPIITPDGEGLLPVQVESLTQDPPTW